MFLFHSITCVVTILLWRRCVPNRCVVTSLTWSDLCWLLLWHTLSICVLMSNSPPDLPAKQRCAQFLWNWILAGFSYAKWCVESTRVLRPIFFFAPVHIQGAYIRCVKHRPALYCPIFGSPWPFKMVPFKLCVTSFPEQGLRVFYGFVCPQYTCFLLSLSPILSPVPPTGDCSSWCIAVGLFVWIPTTVL